MFSFLSGCKRSAGVLAAVFTLMASVMAQATTLKISTLYPDGTSMVSSLKDAGEKIAQETDGRVKLKVYPGGVMGSDKDVQRKIRIGQLHGSMAQGGAFARAYKDSQILNVPLAFRSLGEVDYVRKHLDEEIRQGFAENGWETFGLVDGGFAYVMSNQPVATVADLREQKLWLPANDPASEKAAKAFELSPIVLNIGSVLTSLQTGAIDAIASPPVAALTLQWYTKVSHMTDVPLLYTFGVMAISKRHFSRLSDADQQTVRSILLETFGEINRSSREENIQALNVLKQQGIKQVSPSAEQLKEWRSYADKATAQLVEEGEISKAMLDRLNSLLEEYRATH